MAQQNVERKLAAILAADVAGYSRLIRADEEGTLARLRSLRHQLIDPAIDAHHGRIVKTTGDGILIEFASVVDAVRCALEVQRGVVSRNSDVPADKRIEFRVGINLGDVVVEGDDLLGDGINVASRLDGLAEPGGICVSEDAYRHLRGKVDATLIDIGQQRLKNIAEPVHVYAIAMDAIAAGISVVAAARAPRLSIVVLPFANFGGDKEQDYFVDGLTDSLTTDLSRIPGSFVIARNTAFTYKGKAVDVKNLGHQLGVRYVLEGSVQRGGKRLRVNVQLLDAESGAHLWAERFNQDRGDLFEMQEEIVTRLARALDAELTAAEARHAERSPNSDAIDLVFRGWAAVNLGFNPVNLRRAERFFDQALTLDPASVAALAGRALAKSQSAIFHGNAFTPDERAGHLAAAEADATKALGLVPHHAMAHLALGSTYVATNRAALGIAECDEAIALDRNQANAYAIIALAKLFLGRADEIEENIAGALRLSPRDTFAYYWCAVAGTAKLAIGRDSEAVTWFLRSIEADRNFPLAHFFLAAALAHQGNAAEAQAATTTGLALDPTFTVRRFRDGVPTDNPTYLAQRERIYDGMRKAGMPEK